MTLQQIPSESFRERSTPVLKTERLVMRAPRLGDVKTIAMLANDRRIAENTARIPHPYRLADAEDFVATANFGNEAIFAITLRKGTKKDGTVKDEVIGACGFTQIDRHPPEVGYWLGVEHWGRGYATEAVRAMIDHIFTDLDCEAIQSTARVTNPASRRVLEKCGFQWTGAGLLRIRAISSSAPVDRFRLDRGLWASLKSWGQTQYAAA
ncbi:MAG TPA: GNAT family N-acetyltransferase [Xanthobacteraceae bacterium]|nr:GNAT family N-acetyltransferase [Xanthobacteraceae bacterium]